MDDDFERRREMRRQKREEMRLEAERMAYQRNDEDEEEAARERRRRARQERMRCKDSEEGANPADSTELNNSHSVTVTESVSSSVMSISGGGGDDEEEQALQDRLAKREERRLKRLKEAQDRQKELDTTDPSDSSSARWGRHHSRDEEPQPIGREQEVMQPEKQEVEEEEEEEEEVAPEEEEEKEEVEEKPRRSYLREQESFEDKSKTQNKMEDKDGERKRETRQQNGGVHEDSTPKHKKSERTLSRGSLRSPEASAEEVDEEAAREEAERKLEELRRRREESENEEFEKMRQKQQEAEVELEELKRKREERRKILEEEEKQRKQEEADRKAREEDEKRRMKEEIERRRAEAAEKRQKVEECVDGENRKPFKCVSPRGSSLKIEERTEFLNKSAKKSSVKSTHTPVVSKIDNRLEQYTSAVQSNKEVRSPRPAAIDLPVVTDGIRSIKSMWEKGNVFGSSGGVGSANKDAAGMKIGVAGRINDWLNKTPETGKTSGGRPVDLKPGDVTSKRNLWENKGSPATKVTIRGDSKSVANGMGH